MHRVGRSRRDLTDLLRARPNLDQVAAARMRHARQPVDQFRAILRVLDSEPDTGPDAESEDRAGRRKVPGSPG